MDQRLRMIGAHVTRYGLVVVLLWIGGMKFTTYEAEGIKPMVANGPLMGWVYGVMSVTAFSALLGGFPAVSAMPGQFVLKDIVLMGAALWTAGEALSAARSRRAGSFGESEGVAWPITDRSS
jgi:reactive chlorine resistance protein C